MQGDPDDELDIQELGQPIQEEQQQDLVGELQQEQPQNINMMKISAGAYTGSPSDSTISLLLQLKGTKAVALADTGSTNMFMDYKFAIKHNTHTSST